MAEYITMGAGAAISVFGFLLKQSVFNRISEVEARASAELEKAQKRHDQHISELEARVNERLDDKLDSLLSELKYVREQQAKLSDQLGSLREAIAGLAGKITHG